MQSIKTAGHFIFDEDNPFRIGTGDSVEFSSEYCTYGLEIITGVFTGTTVFIQGHTFEGELDLVTKKGWIRDVNRNDNSPSWLVLYLGIHSENSKNILPMYGYSKKDLANNFIDFDNEF